MEVESPVDALPEVGVEDWRHRAESLPLPVVFAPVVQLAADAAADVTATGYKRDSRRAVERFEPADDREQLEAVAAIVTFSVGRGQLVATASRLQGEFPIRIAVTRAISFGVQQVVRQRHWRASGWRVPNSTLGKHRELASAANRSAATA